MLSYDHLYFLSKMESRPLAGGEDEGEGVRDLRR